MSPCSRPPTPSCPLLGVRALTTRYVAPRFRATPTALAGALVASTLVFACAAPAAPQVSAAAPAQRPGKSEPERVTLYPGTAEYRTFLEQIHQDILQSRAALDPILADDDVAQLTIDGTKLTVARIDEAHALRTAAILERDEPADQVGARWFRRRGGPGRIFVVMGEGSLLFNIDQTGISLEPGSLTGDGGGG